MEAFLKGYGANAGLCVDAKATAGTGDFVVVSESPSAGRVVPLVGRLRLDGGRREVEDCGQVRHAIGAGAEVRRVRAIVLDRRRPCPIGCSAEECEGLLF